MSTSVSYNSVTYHVPGYRDTGYAQGSGNLSQYLVALATGSLTLAGGTFNLAAEVDFGSSYGLKALYFKGRTANPASAGQVRLAVTDTIKWRNNANSADLALAVDGSNQLTFNGVVVATGGLSGSGTANRMAKFTGSATVGNGLLQDDGTDITLPSGQLFLSGGGSVGAPALAIGTADSGLYYASMGMGGGYYFAQGSAQGLQFQLPVSLSAGKNLSISSTGKIVLSGDGSSSAPVISLGSGTQTGLYLLGGTDPAFTNSGSTSISFPASETFQTQIDSTGAGSAALGANCPAVTASAPYTWVRIKTSDDSVCYIPAWK